MPIIVWDDEMWGGIEVLCLRVGQVACTGYGSTGVCRKGNNNTHRDTHVRGAVCACVCVYVCMYVYVYVCVCVLCVCVCGWTARTLHSLTPLLVPLSY